MDTTCPGLIVSMTSSSASTHDTCIIHSAVTNRAGQAGIYVSVYCRTGWCVTVSTAGQDAM